MWEKIELVDLSSIKQKKISVTPIPKQNNKKAFEGQVWCVSGSLDNFRPRSKALDIIVENGGYVVPAITANVTHLLSNGDMYTTKFEKAKRKGIKIVEEKQFIAKLKQWNIEYA